MATTQQLKSVPGVYIAHHHWLDREHGQGCLHKVGHTGELGSRLTDSAYVTCFPEGWTYVATLECATKEAAFLLETAVLHCARHRRVDGRELVRMTSAELVKLATDVVASLKLATTLRHNPKYALPVRAKSAKGGGELPSSPTEPTAWAASRPLIEHFTVPNELDITVSRLGNGDDDSFVDELLSWDFAALKLTLPPPRLEPPPALEMLPMLNAPRVLDSADADQLADEIEDFALVEAAETRSPFDAAVPVVSPIEQREYQRDAARLCLAELRANERAILQMACRCGKTPVAYEILREFLESKYADEEPVSALFLVPGLPLLRQTAQKLAGYGFAEPILLVGSDPRPVPLPDGRSLTMTTDPAVVLAFLRERGRRLVISTYQSSPQVPHDQFVLTVFDEAHRVCGGVAPRPFNHFILKPRVGARLFMTATPAYDPINPRTISMKDRERFGGVAYRYHLRQGITAGYVNDFRLEIVAAPADPNPDAVIPTQIMTAMSKVDKLLVFCRNIGHANRLCEALKATPLAAGVAPFECLVVHSKLPAGGATAALLAFATPGTRVVLFNCRICQEGVEIPPLNGIFFASPRHSAKDIIQSLCRPLNRLPDKPTSIIFLPVLHDAARKPDDPENLRRYATIVPFIDALLDEDSRLYEHLLDPASPYPIEVVGTHSLAIKDARSRAALMSAVRRAVRYNGSTSARPVERLLRSDVIPWERGFGELKRVVEQCGRYPKTTELYIVGDAKTNLHTLYKSYVTKYQKGLLEPFQAKQLEELPGWDPYGIEGPYPWALCIQYLEQWLKEHAGQPPLIEVNRGGYIGLDATPMERLSGAMTIVNQCDGKPRKGGKGGSGYVLSEDKQRDLERVCAPYKLRWKKERDANGEIIEDGPPTFIQEAHRRFKDYYAAHGSEGEYIQMYFPFYPQKHSVQERPDVHLAKVAPPKRKTKTQQKKEDAKK